MERSALCKLVRQSELTIKYLAVVLASVLSRFLLKIILMYVYQMRICEIMNEMLYQLDNLVFQK